MNQNLIEKKNSLAIYRVRMVLKSLEIPYFGVYSPSFCFRFLKSTYFYL